MNELANRWVEALESGDYEQGQNYLRDTSDGFCCLGVLCDLVNPNGWSLPESDRWYSPIAYAYGDGHTEMPPDALLAKAGISTWFAGDLTVMNDTEQRDFGYIAGQIRSYFDNLPEDGDPYDR